MALAACADKGEQSSVNGACTGDSAEQAYSRLKPAVARITTDAAEGTGFVIGTKQLVTNAHVVANARQVSIEFSDGRTEKVPLEEIRGDSKVDIAILNVDTKAVPSVEVANPDDLTVGKDLVAIGYPLDLPGEPKLTKGTFSGHTDSFLQTDAAVNPGNSGGPLADLCGRVVGVIRLGGAQNIALAVPIDSATEVRERVQNGLGESFSELSGEVKVVLQEYSIIPDRTSTKAGKITFNIENKGPNEAHEMLVFKTDTPLDKLPTQSDGALDEEAPELEPIDEISEINPGQSKSLTVELEAGRYILVCNVGEETGGQAIRHFQQGMLTAFTVE